MVLLLLYSRSPPTFQVIAAAIISILNFPRHYTNKQQLYRKDNQYALQRGFYVLKIHNSRLRMANFCLFIKKPKSHLFFGLLPGILFLKILSRNARR